MVSSRARCPEDAKQYPVVHGAEFGEGSTYCIYTVEPRLPRPFTIRNLRESATFGWS